MYHTNEKQQFPKKPFFFPRSNAESTEASQATQNDLGLDNKAGAQEYSSAENPEHYDGESNPYKVFVGGIGQSTSTETIREYFSQFGKVVKCELILDSRSGKSRRFGFIIYDTIGSAQAAISKKHRIDCVTVECRRALSRSEAKSKTPHDSLFNPNKIFVGGVPDVVEEKEFKEFFSVFGEITDASLAYDRANHRLRGFGFIEFALPESADNAVGHHIIKGKRVEAKKALPRQLLQNRSSNSQRETFHRPTYASEDLLPGSFQGGVNASKSKKFAQQSQFHDSDPHAYLSHSARRQHLKNEAQTLYSSGKRKKGHQKHPPNEAAFAQPFHNQQQTHYINTLTNGPSMVQVGGHQNQGVFHTAGSHYSCSPPSSNRQLPQYYPSLPLLERKNSPYLYVQHSPLNDQLIPNHRDSPLLNWRDSLDYSNPRHHEMFRTDQNFMHDSSGQYDYNLPVHIYLPRAAQPHNGFSVLPRSVLQPFEAPTTIMGNENGTSQLSGRAADQVTAQKSTDNAQRATGKNKTGMFMMLQQGQNPNVSPDWPQRLSSITIPPNLDQSLPDFSPDGLNGNHYYKVLDGPTLGPLDTSRDEASYFSSRLNQFFPYAYPNGDQRLLRKQSSILPGINLHQYPTNQAARPIENTTRIVSSENTVESDPAQPIRVPQPGNGTATDILTMMASGEEAASQAKRLTTNTQDKKLNGWHDPSASQMASTMCVNSLMSNLSNDLIEARSPRDQPPGHFNFDKPVFQDQRSSFSSPRDFGLPPQPIHRPQTPNIALVPSPTSTHATTQTQIVMDSGSLPYFYVPSNYMNLGAATAIPFPQMLPSHIYGTMVPNANNNKASGSHLQARFQQRVPQADAIMMSPPTTEGPQLAIATQQLQPTLNDAMSPTLPLRPPSHADAANFYAFKQNVPGSLSHEQSAELLGNEPPTPFVPIITALPDNMRILTTPLPIVPTQEPYFPESSSRQQQQQSHQTPWFLKFNHNDRMSGNLPSPTTLLPQSIFKDTPMTAVHPPAKQPSLHSYQHQLSASPQSFSLPHYPHTKNGSYKPAGVYMMPCYIQSNENQNYNMSTLPVQSAPNATASQIVQTSKDHPDKNAYKGVSAPHPSSLESSAHAADPERKNNFFKLNQFSDPDVMGSFSATTSQNTIAFDLQDQPQNSSSELTLPSKASLLESAHMHSSTATSLLDINAKEKKPGLETHAQAPSKATDMGPQTHEY